MTTLKMNTAKVEQLVLDFQNNVQALEAINVNTAADKALNMALFACGSYTVRNDGKSAIALRNRLFIERLKHFTWQAIISELRAWDDTLSFSCYYYGESPRYGRDAAQAAYSSTSLKDAYKGDIEFYDPERKALALPNMENVDKLIQLMRGSALNDDYHVTAFLFRCGASYKTDVKHFTKRMTWRATADSYASEWRYCLMNLYRIFCENTARAWSWDSIYSEVNNSANNMRSGVPFDAFSDMCVLTVNGNGNATVQFTPEAINILNQLAAQEINDITAYEYTLQKAREMV